MANRVPAVGRIALSPMLNERGRLIGDFTMCRVAEERVLSGRHLRGREILPALVRRDAAAEGVTIRPCAMEYAGLSVAGPNSARAAAAARRRRPVQRRLSRS